MHTIAIDCGNSFIKGACISSGEILRLTRRQAPSSDMEGDFLNPSQINALVGLVREILLELAADEREIVLCISNEMHGFVLAYQNGEPFTDYISWKREWGGIELEGLSGVQLLQQDSLKDDLRHTGMPVRAGLPSSNLYYLIKQGVLENQQDSLCFYTLGDYILRRISGKELPCHPTNAAATGLYDLRTGGWNSRLIQAVSGDNLIFPAIGADEESFEINGLVVHAFPAVGDQQAALLGAGLRDESTVSYNIGTGGQVSMLTSQMDLSDRYQIRPYFDGMYLKTFPHIPSGRALNVIVRFVKDILDHFSVDVSEEIIWNELLCAENQCADTLLCCDLSFFENGITDRKAGAILNIGEQDLSLGAVIKSAFKKISDNFIFASEIICPDAKKVGKVLFSGGIAEKIRPVREQILQHYAEGISSECAVNETLLGLYRYGMMKRGKGKE